MKRRGEREVKVEAISAKRFVFCVLMLKSRYDLEDLVECVRDAGRRKERKQRRGSWGGFINSLPRDRLLSGE